MKKIAVVFLFAMMLFGIVVSASANSVSLGYLVNGKCKTVGEDGNNTFDAKNIILGGNLEVNNKLGISAELTDGDLDKTDVGGSNYDNFSYKLKGSYSMLKNKLVRLDLSFGYFYRKWDAKQVDFEHEATSFILGTDATFKLAENMNMTAVFEYGLSPDGESRYYQFKRNIEMDSLINYQVKFNYLFTKHVGLSLGYRSSCWESKDDDNDTIGGIETGLTYKF